MPKLSHSLNRQVMVAIPSFFGDAVPRRCTLVDIEAVGVWVKGDALKEQLVKLEDQLPLKDSAPVLFFPFDHILYVLDPAQFAYLARRKALGNSRDASDPEPPAGHGDRPHANRSTHRPPKPSR